MRCRHWRTDCRLILLLWPICNSSSNRSKKVCISIVFCLFLDLRLLENDRKVAFVESKLERQLELERQQTRQARDQLWAHEERLREHVEALGAASRLSESLDAKESVLALVRAEGKRAWVQSHLVTLGGTQVITWDPTDVTRDRHVLPSVGAGDEYYIRYWLYVTSVPAVTTRRLRRASQRHPRRD